MEVELDDSGYLMIRASRYGEANALREWHEKFNKDLVQCCATIHPDGVTVCISSIDRSGDDYHDVQWCPKCKDNQTVHVKEDIVGEVAYKQMDCSVCGHMIVYGEVGPVPDKIGDSDAS